MLVGVVVIVVGVIGWCCPTLVSLLSCRPRLTMVADANQREGSIPALCTDLEARVQLQLEAKTKTETKTTRTNQQRKQTGRNIRRLSLVKASLLHNKTTSLSRTEPSASSFISNSRAGSLNWKSKLTS